MSRASAAVRFPDGTIKYTLYNGTVDHLLGILVDTIDEAWGELYEQYRNSESPVDFWPEPIGEVEDVEVYSDYGGGFWWPAKAARNAVVGPVAWDEFWEIDHDGQPDWVVWQRAGADPAPPVPLADVDGQAASA